MLFVQRLPRDRVQGLGASLGSLAFMVARRDAERARRNLRLAFPGKSEGEVEDLARLAFRSLGRVSTQWVNAATMTKEELARKVPVEGLEELERIRASGRGVVLLSAHFDCWEMLGASLGVQVARYAAVAKALYDPRIDDIIRSWRARFGEGTILVSDTRSMLRLLKDGGVLGVLADQSGRGVVNMMLPWFGHDAPTPVGAIRLAARTDAAVMSALARPREGGVSLQLEPIAARVREGDEREVMTRFNRKLEERVRAYPDRWVWLHDRWSERGRIEGQE
jgi:KDO2-lipid IV(A) lauroyltransferase